MLCTAMCDFFDGRQTEEKVKEASDLANVELEKLKGFLTEIDKKQIYQRQNRSHAKGRSLPIEAVDVVDTYREPQIAVQFGSRTPWLIPWGGSVR